MNLFGFEEAELAVELEFRDFSKILDPGPADWLRFL